MVIAIPNTNAIAIANTGMLLRMQVPCSGQVHYNATTVVQWWLGVGTRVPVAIPVPGPCHGLEESKSFPVLELLEVQFRSLELTKLSCLKNPAGKIYDPRKFCARSTTGQERQAIPIIHGLRKLSE